MSNCLNRAWAWAICVVALSAGQVQAAEPAKRAAQPARPASAPTPTLGTVSDSRAIAAAAIAAVRDSDPNLNGTVREALPAPGALAAR